MYNLLLFCERRKRKIFPICVKWTTRGKIFERTYIKNERFYFNFIVYWSPSSRINWVWILFNDVYIPQSSSCMDLQLRRYLCKWVLFLGSSRPRVHGSSPQAVGCYSTWTSILTIKYSKKVKKKSLILLSF